MFFQPGKRKGNSRLRIVNAAEKRSSVVKLPAPVLNFKEIEDEDEEVSVNVGESDSEGECPSPTSEHVEYDYDEWGNDTHLHANTSYKARRARLALNWEKIRKKLMQTSLQLEGFTPSKCIENGCNKQAETRCRDCGYDAYYCLDCCNSIHKEKFQFHFTESLRSGGWTHHAVPGRVLHHPIHVCNGTHYRSISVIDINGVHHEVQFEYCTCVTIPESLLCYGLWSATPVEPTLAFPIRLMELTLALMMECHVSIYDLSKALNFFENPLLKKRKVYEQFIDAFEEFRYHMKTTPLYDCKSETASICAPNCPACPKSSGKLFVSLDACFGLPRKKTSGTSYREPLSGNMYFHNQDKVDQFLSSYPVTLGSQVPNKECSDFQAGVEMISKGKYNALDETAVCGLACKHGIPMDFLNLKGGERLAYGVYLLTYLTEKTAGNDITVHFMYDICCLLETHLKKQKNTELLNSVKLACPQFHVYGHGATCQMMYSPRRLVGWGLVDGEVLERLWSYLRLFRKMTKEMSASHREDILSDALYYYSKKRRSKTVLLLYGQHKRCLELSTSATMEFEDLRKKSPVPITDEMVTEWKQREKEYLRKSKPDEVDLGRHQWVLEYFSLLHQYYTARNQISEGVDSSHYSQVIAAMNRLNNRLLKMEAEYNIQNRWTPTEEKYMSALRTQEAVKAKQTLDMILISGRRRWFLLSLKKKYADGQAQAKRLSRSITKESGNLRKLVKKYNSSIEILKQNGYDQFPFLSWEDASDVNSQIYTINVPNEDAIPVTIKRAAIDACTMVKRCSEEQEILLQEMANCVDDYYYSCADKERDLEELGKNEFFASSYLLKGSYALRKKELDRERLNLFVAYNLFRGLIPLCEETKQYVNKCFRCTTFVPEEYEIDDEVYSDEEIDEDMAENSEYYVI